MIVALIVVGSIFGWCLLGLGVARRQSAINMTLNNNFDSALFAMWAVPLWPFFLIWQHLFGHVAKQRVRVAEIEKADQAIRVISDEHGWELE